MGKIAPIVLIVLLTTTSCTKSLGECLDDIFFPDIFCWSLMYDVNGEEYENSYYVKNGIHIIEPVTDLMSCIIRYYPYSEVQDYDPIPFEGKNMSVIIDFFRLHLLLYQDGHSKFIEGKKYTMNGDCIAIFEDISPASTNKLGMILLEGTFMFKRSIILGKGRVINVYFDFVEVMTQRPDWYNGEYSVGDTIRVTNGHFVQSITADNYNNVKEEQLISK